MKTLTALLIVLVCQIGIASEYVYDSRGNLKEVRINTEQPYYNPNNNGSIRGHNNGKPAASKGSKKHKKLETKKIKVKQK